MLFGAILERFALRYPVGTMTRASLEFALAPASIASSTPPPRPRTSASFNEVRRWHEGMDAMLEPEEEGARGVDGGPAAVGARSEVGEAPEGEKRPEEAEGSAGEVNEVASRIDRVLATRSQRKNHTLKGLHLVTNFLRSLCIAAVLLASIGCGRSSITSNSEPSSSSVGATIHRAKDPSTRAGTEDPCHCPGRLLPPCEYAQCFTSGMNDQPCSTEQAECGETSGATMVCLNGRWRQKGIHTHDVECRCVCRFYAPGEPVPPPSAFLPPPVVIDPTAPQPSGGGRPTGVLKPPPIRK